MPRYKNQQVSKRYITSKLKHEILSIRNLKRHSKKINKKVPDKTITELKSIIIMFLTHVISKATVLSKNNIISLTEIISALLTPR